MTTGAEFTQALDAFQRGDLDQARAIASDGLRSAGGSPQLQHLAGLIECRLGRPGEGLVWLQRASEAEPDNVGYKVMLVRALIDCGRPAEALSAAPMPEGSSPAELALLHARAEAAEAAGEDAAAVQAWGRFCSTGAGDWRAWSSYGAALSRSGRWPEAARALAEATELNPKELQLRRSLATAYAESGDHDSAADTLKDWADAAQAGAHDRMHLARLLADLGRDEEAIAQLDIVLRASIGKGFDGSGKGLVTAARDDRGQLRLPLIAEMARLLERTNRIDALRELLDDAEGEGVARDRLAFPAAAVALRDGDAQAARQLLEGDDPSADPLRWRRLMVRIADALDDSQTAFEQAEAMNRSVPDRDRWLSIGSEYVASVRAVADRVTADWAAQVRPLPPLAERANPAFLVGFPRSGTTLLDTFLMGHTGTAVIEEVPLLTLAQQRLGDGEDLPQRTAEELEAARNVYLDGISGHVPAGFGGLVIDKLPLNMLAPRFIHTLFPGARLIFAQRHPCDCVLSCFMQPFALNQSMACFLDLELAASFYDSAMTLWTRCTEVLPLDVHGVVYEELVEDPEAALRPLIAFLGLDWREDLLDHRSTARARGAISTPSYDQVAQPLTRAPAGRWKRYEKQLEPVLPILLPWAERLGYVE